MPDVCIPTFPCESKPRQGHRPQHGTPLYNACVARPVGPKEVREHPKALKAMQDEWSRLRAVGWPDGQQGVWDETKVREWREVKAEARHGNAKAHIGRIFGIVVEKNRNFR